MEAASSQTMAAFSMLTARSYHKIIRKVGTFPDSQGGLCRYVWISGSWVVAAELAGSTLISGSAPLCDRHWLSGGSNKKAESAILDLGRACETLTKLRSLISARRDGGGCAEIVLVLHIRLIMVQYDIGSSEC